MLPDVAFHPIAEVGGKPLDRPDDDRRDVVTVQFLDAGDEGIRLVQARFEECRSLGRSLDLSSQR